MNEEDSVSACGGAQPRTLQENTAARSFLLDLEGYLDDAPYGGAIDRDEKSLQNYLAVVVAAERERCAKIAESMFMHNDCDALVSTFVANIVACIRSGE